MKTHVRMVAILITTLLVAVFVALACAEDTLTIATWNIENLGGQNRGFGAGFGSGDLGPRTERDLQMMADLIKNTLEIDLIAAQEIAITDFSGEKAKNKKLDQLCEMLGNGWKYFLSTPRDEYIPEGHSNIFCAFVYNSNKLSLDKTVEMDLPNVYIGKKRAFDRRPLIGYFKVIEDGKTTNDFVLVNIHLASGQYNDENHLASMVMIEQNLNHFLSRNKIRESDRIVLGDFNDNPYAVKDDGSARYTNFLYNYMAYKKYRDLVTDKSPSTRMDKRLTSIIDHLLINNSADRHIPTEEAEVYRPSDQTPEGLAEWRKSYSDHFPVLFKLKIESKDDDKNWS